VFAKLDSRTVEKQNKRLSVTTINYSSELMFAYGRVRVRLCRPYVYSIGVSMHTAGRMHSIGQMNYVTVISGTVSEF